MRLDPLVDFFESVSLFKIPDKSLNPEDFLAYVEVSYFLYLLLLFFKFFKNIVID